MVKHTVASAPPPLFPGEIRVIKDELGFGARAQTKRGFIYFYITELTYSRQSIDAVVEIEIDVKGEKRPSFIQRIDLRSSSAIRSLVTDLNNAYGGKREETGYNWALILNSVIAAVSNKIKQQQVAIDLSEVAFEEPTFLLSPFLQQDAPNLVFAQSEVGKTFFVQRLCLSLISGQDFLGFPSPKGKKVLYLDYEDSAAAFASRLHKLCKGMVLDYKATVQSLVYFNPSGSLRNNLEIVRKIVKDNNIDLIVVDAGGDAAGGSPNDEEKVIDLFNALGELPGTKLMLHHEPKYVVNEAAAFYGSMYWKARSRVAWRLEMESEDEFSKLVKLSVQKKSNLPPQPVLYYRQSFTGVTLDEVFGEDATPMRFIPSIKLELEQVTTTQSRNSVDDTLLEALEKHGDLSASQLSEMIGKARSWTHKALQNLADKNLIEYVKKGRTMVWKLK